MLRALGLPGEDRVKNDGSLRRSLLVLLKGGGSCQLALTGDFRNNLP